MSLPAQSIDCPPKADARSGRRMAGNREHDMEAAETTGLIAADAIHPAGSNPPCPG